MQDANKQETGGFSLLIGQPILILYYGENNQEKELSGDLIGVEPDFLLIRPKTGRPVAIRRIDIRKLKAYNEFSGEVRK
jgi:hypothetical protein